MQIHTSKFRTEGTETSLELLKSLVLTLLCELLLSLAPG